MYLLYDDFMSYKEIMDYNDLKHFLIEEIKERLFENLNEKDIVKECVSQLEKLAKGDWSNIDIILTELSFYGWNIISLNKLKGQLRNLEEFYARNHKCTDIFSNVINLLEDKKNFD